MKSFANYRLIPSLILLASLSGGFSPAQATTPKAPLCIGITCHPPVKSAEAFIPVLAKQIQRYNLRAKDYWPNSKVVNQIAIVVTMDRRKAWKILPTGEYQAISVKQADRYKKTTGYDTEFIPFKTPQGEQGIVLTLNETALKDPKTFAKYPHLGTYDMFITYVHELFHVLEQPHWNDLKETANAERSEYQDQIEARAIRGVIYQQLLNAFIYPNKKTFYARRAAATHRYYQKHYPKDATNALFFDRHEGTAFYYEVVTSLYSAYPAIKNQADLMQAYGIIAKNIKVAEASGLVIEGYNLGAAAGLLLDQLQATPTQWKLQLMRQVDGTALNLLAEMFDNSIKASDVVLPTKAQLKVYSKLAQEASKPAVLSDESLQALKTILDNAKQESPAAYQQLLDELKTSNPAAYEQLVK